MSSGVKRRCHRVVKGCPESERGAEARGHPGKARELC